MTQPQPAEQPDGLIQLAVGLAETPLGQRLALTLTVLLGKDNAAAVADTIKQTAEAMSASGLIVAGNGTLGAVAEHG